MPKPNYAFEKRQRELAKKKKKEEKAARKAHGKPEGASGVEGEAGVGGEQVVAPAPSEAGAAQGASPADPKA